MEDGSKPTVKQYFSNAWLNDIVIACNYCKKQWHFKKKPGETASTLPEIVTRESVSPPESNKNDGKTPNLFKLMGGLAIIVASFLFWGTIEFYVGNYIMMLLETVEEHTGYTSFLIGVEIVIGYFIAKLLMLRLLDDENSKLSNSIAIKFGIVFTLQILTLFNSTSFWLFLLSFIYTATASIVLYLITTRLHTAFITPLISFITAVIAFCFIFDITPIANQLTNLIFTITQLLALWYLYRVWSRTSHNRAKSQS